MRTSEKKLGLRVGGAGVGVGNALKRTTKYVRISDLFRNNFSLLIWKLQFLFYRRLCFIEFAVILCNFNTYFFKIYNFKDVKE